MLDDLALFVRIVESGSLSAAAAKAQMPGATLTRRLQKLEQDLGCKLLHRSARRLLPTPEGWLYYERCRPLLASLQQATASLDAELSQVAGSIRVLAPVTLANGLLREAWAGFLERYPDVQLELRLSNSIEDLLDQGADIALRVGDLEDSLLNQRRLGVAPTAMLASPAYLERQGWPQTPADLSGLALLLAEPIAQWWLVHADTGETVCPPMPSAPRLRVNEMQLAVDMAIAGLGVVYCPLQPAMAAMEAGQLVHALPRWRGVARPVHAVWPRQGALPARVRALVDHLCAYAEANALMSGSDRNRY